MIHQMEDLINLAEFDECCCDAFGDILTLYQPFLAFLTAL